VRQQLVLARSANFLEVRTEVVRLEAGVGVELRVELEGTPTTTSIQAPYGAMDWPVELASPLAGRWVSAADGGYGLTVIADRATAWNRSIEGIGAVLFGPAADEPTARTDGDSRLAIYPHAGNWLEAGVPHLADGFATPLLSELEPPHGGRLGERFSFFSSDHPTVSMEWMKRARKGDEVVLRLVNRGSAPARAVVESACPRVSARRANLLEDPGDPISGSRSGFPVQFRSHEIATVVVDCEP
jgi:alpha-mannosidase